MMSCGESESKFRTTEEQETSCERSSSSSPTRQSDPRPLKSRVLSLLAVGSCPSACSRARCLCSSHCREQSVRCTARENPIQEFCVRSLCTSAFLCGLCLVQGSEFEPVPLLVGISPCFATIIGLRTDPCLYRSLCFSCIVPKWRHFSLLFSVKLFLLLLPLRPLPDFLVPRFGGFKSFYRRRRENMVLDDEIWCFCGRFLWHL